MKNKTLKTIALTLLIVNSLLGSGYATASVHIAEAAKSADLSRAYVNISTCQIFPDNNFWNVPVDSLPVHPLSSTWINSIGASQPFHMDFGSGTWNGGPIGIPYNVVSGSAVNFYNFNFYYPDESDPGPYPLPANPAREWGSDHHILTIDTDDCKLYEVYDSWKENGLWYGGSGAIWDLNSNALRTNTWTSADAAGLPILPGLARYDEVAAGVIEHALRFTADCTANNYIWPARHKALHGTCANPLPFGARFRLKSSFNISGYSHDAQVLLQAFKTYGIVLADNGSNWYVSGAPNPNWNNDVLHELDNLIGSNFEAVDTTNLAVDPNSAATNYSAIPHVYSIKRMDPNPTSSNTFNFKAYFSEPVTGVDSSDFFSSTTGDITNAQIGNISGSGVSYTVIVNVDSGFGTIRLDVIDDDTIQDISGNPLGGTPPGNGNFTTGESYTRVNTTLINVLSQGTNDGWVLESTENSGVGGTMNTAATTFNLGDDAADKQYRAILHFDTSSLPDMAVITKATLKIKKQGVVGTDPFSVLGGLQVDMRKPSFGTVALASGDFQAIAGRSTVATFGVTPVLNWYSAVLNGSGRNYINKTGTTQFRLRFATDDNNNNVADLMRFFSGNAPAATRPLLIIEYIVP